MGKQAGSALSKPAVSQGDKRASHWDNRVAVAYLRMMGATQRAAADGAGVSLRTVQTYEKHPSYPAAREEARQRWCMNVSDLARARLMNSLKNKDDGDGRGDASPDLALKIVERIDPEFALRDTRDVRPVLPAVVVPTQVNVYLPDNGREVKAEVISENGQGGE